METGGIGNRRCTIGTPKSRKNHSQVTSGTWHVRRQYNTIGARLKEVSMFQQNKFVLALALSLTVAAAHADPLVYVLTDSAQFGTVDYGTGAFNPIGPGIPVGGTGLVPGP